MNTFLESIEDSRLIMIQNYLKNIQLKAPDPYDIWNTNTGQKIKKIYYKNKSLGILPAAILTLFDFYLNNTRRAGYTPREYPIVRAYYVLICMEIYKYTHQEDYILHAEKSLEWLSKNYSKNYRGYCWGINMPWVSKIATYKEDTPHVTHTPYVLEAFLKFQEQTQVTKYEGIVNSILDFLDNDLIKMIDKDDILALSYSPKEETRIVVNANSYAMFSYALLYYKNQREDNNLKNKILRLYNFIHSKQNENGSWYYFADNNQGNFIDCFHSCFILKNIYKANKIIHLPENKEIIAKGYTYLKKCFWDPSRKLFKRFSVTDRPSLIKYDLYDNAEMLNLAVLLKDISLIHMLTASIKKNFIEGKDIYSNIIIPNLRINKNMLRWAAFPYLYALVRSTSINATDHY